MDDFDSISVVPSVASEFSSLSAFSDGGNEAEAAADGGRDKSGAREVTRHPLFWFENDIVNVQVENVAFQVHAHLFTRESDEGRALMSEASGGTLVLADIKAIDFERFLTMLYAKFYDAPKLATAEKWISVLHLAHKWSFTALQAVAARELDSLTTAVDKIVLSQQYGIEFWLEQAYLDVCIADDWLSDGDGLRLGVAAVLKIGRARHELRMPAALKPETSRLDIVRATFGLADAIGSPSSISASSSGSKVDGVDGTADIAAVSTPPLAFNPDVESALPAGSSLDPVHAIFGLAPALGSATSVMTSGSTFEITQADASTEDTAVSNPSPASVEDAEINAQERLKLFIESTFGLSGPDAKRKWDLYAPYGKPAEMELLRQAVVDARTFAAQAHSASSGAADDARNAAALLHAAKHAFVPIKARYEQVTEREAAGNRFTAWLKDCLAFVGHDPWNSTESHSQLKARLVHEQSWIQERRSTHRCLGIQGMNRVKLARNPPFTTEKIDDRRRQLEVDIIALMGSCPSWPAS